MAKLPARNQWKMRGREAKDLVFCHNDLSPHNVIVDPATLKVKAILGWGYSGYYPAEFERRYYRRSWPSFPGEGELNDDRFAQIMLQNVAAGAQELPREAPAQIEPEEDMLQNEAGLTREELAQIKSEAEEDQERMFQNEVVCTFGELAQIKAEAED
jgi:hypothetical protein